MHGGNIYVIAKKAGCAPEELLDFSANINPAGPPAMFWADLCRAGAEISDYPDPECLRLRRAASVFYDCPVEHILAGNGSSELLFASVSSLCQSRVILFAPCYIDYEKAATRAGVAVKWLDHAGNTGFALDFFGLKKFLAPGDMVIIGRPNNPSGVCPEKKVIIDLAHDFPKSLFLIDEAFIDFSCHERITCNALENILVLRSLTKNFAIAGLRLGLLFGHPKLLEQVAGRIIPWSVGVFAQKAGAGLFDNPGYLEKSRALVLKERKRIEDALLPLLGLTIYPGTANFLLLRIDRPETTGHALFSFLLKKKIAIRVCDDFHGLDLRYIRIAVKKEDENNRLISAMREFFGEKHARARKKTPAVMFQGTSSNAGKSVLATAMCRIFLDDGLRVAPFKAQNMSLNSYVTDDGLEMGRAQVTQAMAARLRPDVRMNPVLIKPESPTGAQVIISGRPAGHLIASDYGGYVRTATKVTRAAYDSLASEFNAIVLEGAGSPGEVNLKSRDIVNMSMAAHASALVLLVGDIDRGGVFASFIGTYSVLEPWERKLLGGFIINRFRGDASLLGLAIDITKRFTGKKTFGIIDFIPVLGLPEEDSVAFKDMRPDSRAPVPRSPDPAGNENKHIEIGAIDLPHISNFTDLDPLLVEPDVSLRIIRRGDPIGMPDLLIIPGSKAVAFDFDRLAEEGRIDEIQRYREHGGRILGICGGFQMLGQSMSDPFGIESLKGVKSGIGLLDATTTLGMEKRLTRVRAVHEATGTEVRGYEIHHGRTGIKNAVCWLSAPDGPAGFVSTDGRVFGTYLHGLFDADGFRRMFLNEIRAAKGLEPIPFTSVYDIDAAIDRLAVHVRERLDMDAIYRLMGL